MIINEDIIQQELLGISISPSRPAKFKVQTNYPYNDLKDSEFELLLYQIFKTNNKSTQIKLNYDKCILSSGPDDKGRDISLLKNGVTTGIIQCKKYSKNIDKTTVAKEVIKFILNCIQEKSDIDYNNFTYFLAVSTGVNHEAQTLISRFNSKVVNEPNLEKWVNDIITQYKTINLQYSDIDEELNSILSKIKLDLILPTEITNKLSNNSSIAKTFFDLEKVIDKEAFLEIINGENLNITQFFNLYKPSIINNYSRLNFFGLALPKKPREVQLYSLFVYPTFKRRNGLNPYFHNAMFIDDEYRNSLINPVKDLNYNNIFADIKPFINSKSVEPISTLYIDRLEYNYIPLKKSSIKFNDIFKTSKNIVIIGRPGAGKSSLVKFSICKILEGDKSVFNELKIYQRIPFRVELHKYNEVKIKNNINLIEYLTLLVEQEYQLCYITKVSLENLFVNYETLVFFDGLDEVLDVQERINVRNDIENFTRNHSKVKSIVTSRYESYEEVSFNESEYEILELNNFDDSQMEEYIQKWYAIEEENEKVRSEELESCKLELSKIEDEIKRNPLLLTLILILYRNELELPTSKLDIYEGCTYTLVETRDQREKKLQFNHKITNRISVFSSLAYWQFSNQINGSEKSVTFSNAYNHIKSYLLEKNMFSETHDAEAATTDFLEFAKIRSIFVDNSFTHKTFLEYFTAYYIYATTHGKANINQRDEIILNHIGQSSWQVVLELLICMIDKNQIDFDIIDSIVETQLVTKPIIAINFFLPILKYIKNISPSLVNKILYNSIKICISNIEKHHITQTRSINNNLISLSNDNSYDELIKSAIEEIGNSLNIEIEKANFAVFIAENFSSTVYYHKYISNDENLRLVTNHPYLFILNNYDKIVDLYTFPDMLKLFIERFSIKSVTRTYSSRFGQDIFSGYDRFNWITTILFNKYDFDYFMQIIKMLKGCGLDNMNIKNAIEKDNREIDLTREQLISYLDKNPGKSNTEIIEKALKQYYHFDTNGSKKSAYFDKKNNPNRRFPIPT